MFVCVEVAGATSSAHHQSRKQQGAPPQRRSRSLAAVGWLVEGQLAQCAGQRWVDRAAVSWNDLVRRLRRRSLEADHQVRRPARGLVAGSPDPPTAVKVTHIDECHVRFARDRKSVLGRRSRRLGSASFVHRVGSRDTRHRSPPGPVTTARQRTRLAPARRRGRARRVEAARDHSRLTRFDLAATRS